jgi:hypothetical protein
MTIRVFVDKARILHGAVVFAATLGLSSFYHSVKSKQVYFRISVKWQTLRDIKLERRGGDGELVGVLI